MDNVYAIPELTKNVSDSEARNPNMSVDKPSEQVKRKKVKPLIVIVLAFVSVVMLIFIALVTWKLVSLDKALAEERHARLTTAPLNVSNARQISSDMTKLRLMIENNAKQIQRFEVSAEYPIVSKGDKVPFDNVKLNIGGGYNVITRVFTVPSGAAGLYFFDTHVVTNDQKKVHLAMKKNTENLCGLFEDNKSSPGTDGSTSCSVAALLESGDVVYVEKLFDTGENPLECARNQCGFTGFLMKPVDH